MPPSGQLATSPFKGQRSAGGAAGGVEDSKDVDE